MKLVHPSPRTANTLLVLLILLAVLLAALLGVLVHRALEEERRLREEQAEASREADRLAALATTAPPPPERRGLELLAARDETLRIFYLAGQTAYGLGATDSLSIDAHSWRTVLRDRLRETLGYRLVGYVSERYAPCPTFAEGEMEFRSAYRDYDSFRLAVVVPDSNMVGTAATGFAVGLETLLLAMREEAPYTDILLVVPPNAEDEEAAVILALAAHYGLTSVDTREPLAALLGAGGAPTAEGHTQMAALLHNALLAAAEEPPTPLTPESRLYP